MKPRLVILDRDGTLNFDSDNYIRSVEEVIPLPGAFAAIARLSRAGYRVAIATNQSGLARGYFTRETLDAMHAKLRNLTEAAGGRIDAIEACPHGPDDKCDCRKPEPGLVLRLLDQFAAAPEDCWMIGDSLRDLEAARRAGVRPLLVLTGKLRSADGADAPAFASLNQAVDYILQSDAPATA